ncbi:MAG TPA: phosphatase PAP2 family protein [Chitinophagaceae bacterium]|jgi:undecaprenyl-diphosphatase|nr:phosphatase PAP2 family protein [Chitinophagaceae bacterium]
MGAWEITTLIIGEVLLTLATFSAIVALIVFLIRKPIRKHKPIDMLIFDKIQPGVNAINNKIMLFVTFLGKHQFLIPANLILIFYFLLVKRQTWFSIRVITIAISSLALMLLLKQLFQRKRPLSPLLKAAKGLSFPSGHAIMAVTFYGLLIYILQHTITIDWLKWLATVLMFVLIILIGFSRIYLRVHYASDVAAGFIIGLLWLLLSLAVLKWLESYITAL